jgi:hypothetical protein
MPEETQKAKQGTDPETPPNAPKAQPCTPLDNTTPLTPPTKGSTDPETPTHSTAQKISRLHSRYQILRELGKGGMGQVWGVYDTKQQRRWAVKLALYGQESSLRQEKKALDLLEARAELREDGPLSLCTEWLQGKNLAHAIKAQTKSALPYLFQSALQLAKAHQRGLVHRDMKPSNVWVMPDDQVRIIDWGISSEEGQAQSVSRGTFAFAAPEQLLGAPSKASADVFSLGKILFLLSPRKASLQKIITRATHPNPDERYKDAAYFAQALLLAI